MHGHISQFTDEQLRKELEKREEKRKERPEPKDDIDWSGVKSMAESIVTDVVEGRWYEDNDDDSYMYEEVMTAVYGKDFFKWFNDNAYDY